jgi:hypothetical protein
MQVEVVEVLLVHQEHTTLDLEVQVVVVLDKRSVLERHLLLTELLILAEAVEVVITHHAKAVLELLFFVTQTHEQLQLVQV